MTKVVRILLFNLRIRRIIETIDDTVRYITNQLSYQSAPVLAIIAPHLALLVGAVLTIRQQEESSARKYFNAT